MIQGTRKEIVEKEDIFKYVSPYDIYRLYLGNFEIGEVFCNQLRGESNPSLVVREYMGGFHHFDYGSSTYRGDCFNLVMQKYGCDYPSALQWILKDFGIATVGGKSSKVTWKQPDIIKVRKPPKFHIITRKYNQDELRWWSDRLQDISDLKRENIFAPKEIFRNYKKVYLPPGDLVFCHYYPELDKWKIYRPLRGKRERDTPVHEWKWDTNLPPTVVENIDSLSGAAKGLLTKSTKDRIYLMKLLEMDKIASVQAEDAIFFPQSAIDIFQQIPDRWVNSDNDKKGKEFSWWLTTNYGYKHINAPDDIQGTDFVDMGLSQGHEAVRNHFKIKGFI